MALLARVRIGPMLFAFLVSRRVDQRCLLALARATTLQLAGRGTEASQARLAGRGDCSEGEASLSAVICDRLLQAQPTNPRAAASRTWLGCSGPQSARPGLRDEENP